MNQSTKPINWNKVSLEKNPKSCYCNILEHNPRQEKKEHLISPIARKKKLWHTSLSWTVADQQCTLVGTWVAVCSPHSMLVSMTVSQSFSIFLACCPPWLFPNPLPTIWPSGARCCTPWQDQVWGGLLDFRERRAEGASEPLFPKACEASHDDSLQGMELPTIRIKLLYNQARGIEREMNARCSELEVNKENEMTEGYVCLLCSWGCSRSVPSFSFPLRMANQSISVTANTHTHTHTHKRTSLREIQAWNCCPFPVSCYLLSQRTRSNKQSKT